MAIYKGALDDEGAAEVTKESAESKGYDDSNFKLDSDSKYIIHDETRVLSMESDGGSHTDVYYEIDLDNQTISKISERYQYSIIERNGKATQKLSRTKTLEYTKTLDYTVSSNAGYIIRRVKTMNLKDESSSNIGYWTLEGLNYKEDINATKPIQYLKSLVKSFDNIKDEPNAFKLDNDNKYVIKPVRVCSGCSADTHIEVDLDNNSFVREKDHMELTTASIPNIEVTVEKRGTIDENNANELKTLIANLSGEEDKDSKSTYYYVIIGKNGTKFVYDDETINKIGELLN